MKILLKPKIFRKFFNFLKTRERLLNRLKLAHVAYFSITQGTIASLVFLSYNNSMVNSVAFAIRNDEQSLLVVVRSNKIDKFKSIDYMEHSPSPNSIQQQS